MHKQPSMKSMRHFFSQRLIWLALLLSMGIGAMVARTIWTMRSDEWDFAARTNSNLVTALEQSIGWTLRVMDQSLLDVTSKLEQPGIMELPHELRHQLLFDRPLRVVGLMDVYVIDSRGDIIMDSSSLQARKANYADRDYFLTLMAGTKKGLVIGRPVMGRVTQSWMLPMARSYRGDDGQVAGVVVSSISLSYFNELFSSLNLGPSSGVNLILDNGIIVSRYPYGDADVGKSLAGTENMRRILAGRTGSFMGVASLDKVERFYSFQHVGPYPLVVNVAQSTQAMLAHWRTNALQLAVFALVLMASCVGLAILFTRELAQRQQVAGRLQQAEHYLHTILDNLPSMVSYWDVDQRNRFVNKTSSALYGRTPEELRGLTAREVLGEKDYAFVRPYVEQALQGHPQLFERTVTDASGQLRHTVISHTPDRDGDHGPVRGIFVQMTDITERKRMEDELFQEKELMRLTLHSIGDAVICTDAQGLVTYLNPVARRMTGWQAFDAAGRDVDEVAPLYLSNGQQTQPSPLRVALATQAACGPTRGVVLRRKDGQRFEVEESASPIIDRQRQLTGAVMVLHDVTETMAMAERMARLAQYDPLTDLPNRVLLQDRAQHALAVARRDGKGLAVMYLDLDGFKQVNDTLGHDAGDQLLVEFACRLTAAMRQSDTVCRQGGDEFVVLLPALATPAQIRTVVRKVLAVAQQPFVLQGQELHIGVSGGLALFPQHGDSYDVLARHADTAMYAAKRAGRMQVRCYAGQGAEPEYVDPDDVQDSVPSDL
ncbi:PAS domain S-box-containing protein/diguanylate cyclase (GGDEF)-like protein [Simplicispira sp. 125]|nr:PAS domain S-box-containing protein/diguanylate cyclase (GGDEF)-like protein [Simplicispira sp. 125]REG17762.1 PAS domain S-box-containing protein/diguanylate cyclase (GGDEF)-like protein [Simplicispira sp. 110]